MVNGVSSSESLPTDYTNSWHPDCQLEDSLIAMVSTGDLDKQYEPHTILPEPHAYCLRIFRP